MYNYTFLRNLRFGKRLFRYILPKNNLLNSLVPAFSNFNTASTKVTIKFDKFVNFRNNWTCFYFKTKRAEVEYVNNFISQKRRNISLEFSFEKQKNYMATYQHKK